MKLMIASDLHGSAFWCEKLMAAIRKEQPQKTILLGDLLYHGPRNDLPEGYDPKKVIAMLNEIAGEVLCVRGNCDTEVDQMVLDFPVLSTYGVFFWQEKTVYFTHGHQQMGNGLEKLSHGELLLCGHTHVPACDRRRGYTYINPGSVSIPKENSPHSYMIMEDNSLFWKTLPDGDVFATDTI